MILENSNLGAIFVILAGFLIGAVPAFLIIGFYYNRRFDEEKKALKLKYDRQITALRATVRRLMDRIDHLVNERNKLKNANKGLLEAVRDQHEVADQTSEALDEARQNMMRLQESVDQLHADNMRKEGRLEQARIHQERLDAQHQLTLNQITQTERLQRNLLFAASQLREARVTNQAFEAKVRKGLKPVSNGETTPPAKLDVGLIEGMGPKYAQRLHDSGIHTIGDLAGQTPARVAHFAGLDTWDDSAAWIAEAKLRLAGSSHAQA